MLIAEHREIIRIPNTIKSGKAKVKNIPTEFTLGKGHVVFFYNKIMYLRNRYNKLYAECISRGFNIQDYSDSFKDIDKTLFNDWVETENSREILTERINLRLSTMKNIKYYKKDIHLNDIKL